MQMFIFPASLAARRSSVANSDILEICSGTAEIELPTYYKERKHEANSLPTFFLLIFGCWVRSCCLEHEGRKMLALRVTEEMGGVWFHNDIINPMNLSQDCCDSNPLHIWENFRLFSKQGMKNLSYLSHFWSGSFLLHKRSDSLEMGRHKPIWTNATQEENFSGLPRKRTYQMWTMKHISSIIADSCLKPWNEPAWECANRLRMAERKDEKYLCHWWHYWVI